MGLDVRKRTTGYALQHANSNVLDERNNSSLNSGMLVGSLSSCYTSFKKCSSSLAASAKTCFSGTDDQNKEGVEVTDVTSSSQGIEHSRVHCVVWSLHQSSGSFSQAINSLGLASGPALAMAWNGKDVHEWHRRIAYQVHAAKCSIVKKYMFFLLLLFLKKFMLGIIVQLNISARLIPQVTTIISSNNNHLQEIYTHYYFFTLWEFMIYAC